MREIVLLTREEEFGRVDAAMAWFVLGVVSEHNTGAIVRAMASLERDAVACTCSPEAICKPHAEHEGRWGPWLNIERCVRARALSAAVPTLIRVLAPYKVYAEPQRGVTRVENVLTGEGEDIFAPNGERRNLTDPRAALAVVLYDNLIMLHSVRWVDNRPEVVSE